MENKPDLTNIKNLWNWVLYGLAGVVVALAIRYETKGNSELENCEERYNKLEAKNERLTEKMDALQDTLIYQAYKIKVQEKALDDGQKAFDSAAVQALRSRTQPILNKIKKYSR